ncbi:MAG TPA: hypothetical protein VHU80_07015, partial [Polyangiaceae bacterium]|nr:hypothetical protein [Polyangiaceae bacterium]
VSSDGGRTFSRLMGHCDVGFPTCGPDSTIAMVCREQWERFGGWASDYGSSCAAGGAPAVLGTGGAGGGSGENGAGGEAEHVHETGGSDGAAPRSEPLHMSIESACGCAVLGVRWSDRDLTMFMVVVTALSAAIGRRPRRRKAS